MRVMGLITDMCVLIYYIYNAIGFIAWQRSVADYTYSIVVCSGIDQGPFVVCWYINNSSIDTDLIKNNIILCDCRVRGLPFHNQGGVRVFTPEYNFFFLSEWKYNFFFLSEWKYNFFFITNPSIVLLYDRTRMILWFCERRVRIRACLWLLA